MSINLAIKLLVFQITFSVLISCKQDAKDLNIEGNWQVGWFSPESIDSLNTYSYDDFNYEEIFITKDKIIWFNNISGGLYLSEYYIKNDSLFSALESLGPEYRGLIKKNEKNHFVFTNGKKKVSYFRLADTVKTLDKFIKKNDFDNPVLKKPEKDFGQGFWNRNYDFYKKTIERLNH